MNRLLWTAAGLALAAAVATAVTLPAAPPPVPVNLPADFTAAQVARAAALHAALWPWQIAQLLLPLLAGAVAVPLAKRYIRAAGPAQAPWWRTTVAAGVAAHVAVALPGWRIHVIGAQAGLDVRTNAAWLANSAKAGAITVVLVCAAAVLLRAAQRWPKRAALAVPATAALAVLLGGLLLPVVIEPAFARFTPMPDGELRSGLVAVADRVGVPVSDVLVADASRRTTTLNAYVSGMGPTRRIVVFDTVVHQLPEDEVVMVAAHELGHVAAGDVGRNVGVAAAWAAVVASLAAAAATGTRGAEGAVAVLAAATVAIVATPGANAVTRNQERRADAFALAAAHDQAQVDAFASLMHRLAVTNVSTLEAPAWAYDLLATHPLVPERIARARAAAKARGWEPPPPMADSLTP